MNNFFELWRVSAPTSASPFREHFASQNSLQREETHEANGCSESQLLMTISNTRKSNSASTSLHRQLTADESHKRSKALALVAPALSDIPARHLFSFFQKGLQKQ